MFQLKNLKFKSKFIRFISSFLFIILVYYSLTAFAFFNDLILMLAGYGAEISSFVINMFGAESNYFGNTLFTIQNSLKVSIGCDGSEPIVYLLAAIVSYPAQYLKKLIGILIGSTILFLVNISRIISLFYISESSPKYFDLIHNDFMPFFTLVSSLGLFYIWMLWVNKYKDNQ